MTSPELLYQRKGDSLRLGHIEKRTGLLRCYISRIECGHNEPELATLGKWAKALDLELYQLFFSGEGKPEEPKVAKPAMVVLGKDEGRLVDLFRRMPNHERQLLLGLARMIVAPKAGRRGRKA